MSHHEQLPHPSPPTYYHNSSSTDSAPPPSSLSFMLGPSRAQSHRQSNPYPSGSCKQSDDMVYISKYKDMKRKVQEIELDNDRLHLKCLKTRKSIQRLRLERAILYERLATIPAAENVFPVVSGQMPSAEPYPPPDPAQAQEHYQHPRYPSEVQAQIHADQARIRLEGAHHAHHPQGIQASNQVITGHRPPQRQYGHYPEDSPPIAYHQPTVLIPEGTLPAKQRKSKHDDKSPTVGAFPPSSNGHQEVRNGGSRTYPFVLEYPSAQERGEPVLAPPGYPSEIRFHQYEGSSDRRTIHRNRRDFDRDQEKSNKQRRRPPQEVERDRRRPDSRSRSPRHRSSPRGVYAYPIQNPFMSAERESQSRTVRNDDGDRRHSAPLNKPVAHSDESQRYEAEAKGFGSREDGHTHRPHEHEAEPQQEKALEYVRHLPPDKKRVHLQPNEDNRYNEERGEREGDRAHGGSMRGTGGTDDGYSLPRMRAGEVMD